VSDQTKGPAGKGRPTPKRSDAQKRRGPVTPPPTSRREAAKLLREKQAANRQRVRDGSLRGDDSLLLKRDRGPVRRLVRDVVDGRRSMAWVLLPVMVVTVAAGFVNNEPLRNATSALWLATLAAVIIDMGSTAFDIRRAVHTEFPDESKLLGHVGYGLARTTVMRRWRVPRPQVRP
jgi:hypothetical protein